MHFRETIAKSDIRRVHPFT